MTEDEVYPLRAGYSGKAPAELEQIVVERLIDDWDGLNWQALRQILREHGVSGEECDSLPMMGVRMRCLFAAPKIALNLGGTIATHTGRITPAHWNIVRVEGLAFAGQETEPVLQATESEARAFMDGKHWCTAAYARQRYRIRPQQLTRASTQEKGLRGVVVTRKMAQVGNGKRGRRWVHHAGDLQRLANALERGE